MLLLSPNQPDGFADYGDPTLRYYMPPALAVAREQAGRPAFMLLSYRDSSGEATGGILQMRLALAPLAAAQLADAAAAGAQARPTPFDGARFRLRLRSLLNEADEQTGEWRQAALAGGALAPITVTLTPIELGMLRPLLADGRDVIGVELELTYRGVLVGPPWLATASLAELRDELARLLPGPATADEVVAAFLSLPERQGLLGWQALGPDATPPPRNILLAELALQAIDELFTAEGDGGPAARRHRLRDDLEDAICSWSLAAPRAEERTHRLEWSVASLEEFADPQGRQALFPALSGLDMFGGAQVYVLNELPIAHDAVRQAWVDLRYPTAAGVYATRRIIFDGSSSAARLDVTFPSIVSDFQLDYRVCVTLAPPGGVGWPLVIQRPFVTTTSQVIALGRASAGLDMVRVEAEPRAFASASALEVELLDGDAPDAAPIAEARLDAARPGAWVALPGRQLDAPIWARCVARPPDGVAAAPASLFEGPVVGRAVAVQAYRLEAPPADRVTIALDPEIAPQIVYANVELSGDPAPGPATSGRLLSLDPARPLVWYVRRGSVFDAVRLSYRLRYVALGPTGAALPMATTGWMAHTGADLVVRPPAGRAGEGGALPETPPPALGAAWESTREAGTP